jgi:hypothetical protein
VQEDTYSTVTHLPQMRQPITVGPGNEPLTRMWHSNVGDVTPRDQPKIPIAGNDLFNCLLSMIKRVQRADSGLQVRFGRGKESKVVMTRMNFFKALL